VFDILTTNLPSLEEILDFCVDQDNHSITPGDGVKTIKS
jgi:hypothetical protein